MSSAAASSSSDKPAQAQPQPDQVDLLEEDDEFEEFPAESWTSKDQDAEDDALWEDNWDDETQDDEFTNKLRAELQQQSAMKD